MQLAYVQYDVLKDQPSVNLETVKKRIESVEADGFVLPELALSGYYFESRDAIKPYASEAFNAWMVDAFMNLARVKDAFFVVGGAHHEGDSIFNRAFVITEDGVVHHHDKLALTDNETVFTPGNALNVFKYKGVTMGVMICMDAWYAPVSEALKAQGAQALLVPANFGGDYSLDVLRTRAIETATPVVLANRCGYENIQSQNERFLGQSRIIDSHGNIMREAKSDACVDVITLDLPAPHERRSLIRENMKDDYKHIQHVIMKQQNSNSR